jgi:hypothetical protein
VGAALVAAGAAAANGCSGGARDDAGGSVPVPAGGSATDGGVAGAGRDGTAPLIPFEAVAPESYVSKVKNLLTGLPVTAAELSAVQKDPTALAGMIDGWLALPTADTKMISFFANAFQQTAMTAEDFSDEIGDMTAAPDALMPNLRESFGRTALAMMKAGTPFNQTVTTPSFMMTTALLQFYSFLDERLRNDDDYDLDKLSPPRTKDFVWTATDDTVHHVDLADSLDPASPDYLTWSVGPESALGPVGSLCVPRTFHSAQYSDASVHLFLLQYGTLGKAPVTPPGCPNSYDITGLTPILTASDFSDWRLVTVVPSTPANPSNINLFYDVPALRTATSIVLDVPRIGFFSTPSFLANWATNVNNQARVTTNQSLITALGQSINPETVTIPIRETGLDTQHADPTTVCYTCHKVLDPMREFFRSSYSLPYHEQTDTTEQADVATFGFGGVNAVSGTGGVTNKIGSFAATLAAHPFFAAAWAQKLCVWADSAACDESDPELVRIVNDFTASKLDFRVLVREMMSSPLVTASAGTLTFDQREPIVSIARQAHYCTALSVRLGIDACNLPGAKVATQAQLLSGNLPADGYARGAQIPNLVSAPGLFHRSTVENLCGDVATVVIDAPGGKYTSPDKDGAIADFVANIMGLSSADDRAGAITTVLQGHYASAVAAGATPTQALGSTFTLACTSPLATAIGL